MNTGRKFVTANIGGEIKINDYGWISEIQKPEEFGVYYSKITELGEVGDISSSIGEIKMTLDFIKKIVRFQSQNNFQIKGVEELKYVQGLSLAGYVNFLLWFLKGYGNTGKIVVPTGQGKTLLSCLLAFLNPEKTIILCENNIGKSQFFKESGRVEGLKFSEIGTETVNISPLVIGLWGEFITALQNKTIDFSQYSTIYIDEVDINGLSTKRQQLLQSLIVKHNIKIVGFSATEKQASGKKLDDFYTYDLLNFPMPESFPELYKLGELPNISFKDVILSADLRLSGKLLKDSKDEDIDIFIQNSDWISQILNYHLEYNKGKKFILGMRNNRLNECIIKSAKSKGLNIISLTQENSAYEREQIIQLFKSGKIDGIIGSKLTGRGLDIPECEIVYNSLLTYSPQLFWQLGGRAARFDENINKKEIVTFLPENVMIDSQKESSFQASLPLCFHAFFQSNFFTEKKGQFDIVDKAFELKKLKEEEIKSIDEVNQFLIGYNTYGSFEGRPEVLAKIILSYRGHITYNILTRYLNAIKGSTGVQDYYKEHPEISNEREDLSDDEQKLLALYQKTILKYQNGKNDVLSLAKEKELFKEYQSETNQQKKGKIAEKILGYHYNIIVAIACKIAKNEDEINDFVQVGVEGVVGCMKNYKPYTRFSTFCLIYAYSAINAYSEKLIHIPTAILEICKKIQYILEAEEGKGNTSFSEIQSIIVRGLKMSQEEVLDILKISEMSLETIDDDFFLETIDDDPFNEFFQDEQKKNIEKFLIQRLTPREIKVIQERFGLKNGIERTLNDISKDEGVTRERIRGIESEALNKLRGHAQITIKLQDYKEEFSYEKCFYEKEELHSLNIPRSALKNQENWKKYARSTNLKMKKKVGEDIEWLYNFFPEYRNKARVNDRYVYSFGEMISLQIPPQVFESNDEWKKYAQQHNNGLEYKYMPEDLGELYSYLRYNFIVRNNWNDMKTSKNFQYLLCNYSSQELKEEGIEIKHVITDNSWKKFAQELNAKNTHKMIPEDRTTFMEFLLGKEKRHNDDEKSWEYSRIEVYEKLFSYSVSEIMNLDIPAHAFKSIDVWGDFVRNWNKDPLHKYISTERHIYLSIKKAYFTYHKSDISQLGLTHEVLEDKEKWETFAKEHNKNYQGNKFIHPNRDIIDQILGFQTPLERKQYFLGFSATEIYDWIRKNRFLFDSQQTWQEFTKIINKKHPERYLPEKLVDFKQLWQLPIAFKPQDMIYFFTQQAKS